MTARPPARNGPGPLVRALGRAVTSAVARFPWSWRFFRRPVRRFSDSHAAGWDERVRSDSAEYVAPLVAALDRMQSSPARYSPAEAANCARPLGREPTGCRQRWAALGSLPSPVLAILRSRAK